MSEVPFIGREQELSALAAHLASALHVTVVGPPGCGKTRLAREAAGRIARAADPLDAVVVELGGLRSATQLAQTIACALGRRAAGTSLRGVAAHLASRPTLLVLDDCELPAAAVRVLARGLRPGTRSRILATSTTPLELPGEVVFALANLSLPARGGGLTEVVRSDAARFVVASAATLNAEFALTPTTATAVVHACRALNGLPLALALAAAWIARGASGESFAELAIGEDRRPAANAVRAALDWSIARLAPSARALLPELAVFRSPWSLQAAWRVCQPAEDRLAVLDALERLGEAGLVTDAGGDRWSLPPAVQPHLTPVGQSEVASLRDRHLSWFARRAAGGAEAVGGSECGHDELTCEAPDIRLAFARALERDPALALEMAAGMAHHWLLTGQAAEGYSMATAALEAAASAPRDRRALVCCCAAMLAGAHDGERARAHVAEGLALAEDGVDVAVAGRCRQLASAALLNHDPARAARLADEAVAALRGCHEWRGLALALASTAVVAAARDRRAAVHTACEELRRLPSSALDHTLRARAELAASRVETVAGDPARGLDHAERALALAGERETAMRLAALAARVHALARLGRALEARRVGVAALAAADRLALQHAGRRIELALAVAELALQDLDAAERRARRATWRENPAVAWEVLASVALARDVPGDALEHARRIGEIASLYGSPRLDALARYYDGCAALHEGNLARSLESLQAALAIQVQAGLHHAAVRTLEALGAHAAARADVKRSARLLGASARARAQLGGTWLPPRLDEHEAVAVMRRLSDWEGCWNAGAALSLEQALAYAQRGRGTRARPASGVQSLTATELEVARLAASGATNPEIANQLFMARGTVKAHLASVYRKLTVANRTALAAKMALHR